MCGLCTVLAIGIFMGSAINYNDLTGSDHNYTQTYITEYDLSTAENRCDRGGGAGFIF